MYKDFSSQNLRGCSFKGQNLEGANFNCADIRGANFTGANLQGANFSKAKAGLQKRWTIVIVLVSWLIAGISGLFSAFFGNLMLPPAFKNQVAGWFSLIIVIALIAIIIHQGIKAAVTGTVTFAVTGAVLFSFTNAVARNINFVDGNIDFALIFAFLSALTFAIARAVARARAIPIVIAVAIAFAIAGAFVDAFTFAAAFVFTFAVAGVFAITFAVTFAVARALAFAIVVARVVAGVKAVGVTVAFAFAGAFGEVFLGARAFAVAVIFISLSIYTARQAMKGDEKYALIRSAAIAFGSFGGTSFKNANLDTANFSQAILKSTDFRQANLTRTCFQKVQKLDRVRPGKTYLQHKQLQQVLIWGQGQNKNFDRLDLRGVNLQGAFLNDASFIAADLSKANFQGADLSRAKLVQTQLDNTDFTGATLTGAYIEDWNITSNTNFTGLRCEYVYMRLPTKDNPDPHRQPDNREEVFGNGEFGDFIQPIFDILDLYHSQIVDPRRIAIAFKQLAENHPDAELRIVSMELKEENKFLLRANTSLISNKSELSAEYFSIYNNIFPIYNSSFVMRFLKMLTSEELRQTNPNTLNTPAIQQLDYSGKNLRGRSFKGQNLTGANFCGADIRGADFSNAILKYANFTGVVAGRQKRWIIGYLMPFFPSLYLVWLLIPRAVAFEPGGTSFHGSDLTEADFTLARLKNTDFRKANLTRTRFYQAEQLNHAIVDETILSNCNVLDLLVTGNGKGKSYAGGNLKGANLIGANLREANLKDADISEATFQGVNLEYANLTLTQAVSTDFNNAQMTGACVESWNIDTTTQLDNVDCQFIYLLENAKPGTNDRERRPSSGEFKSGDFTKLFEEVLNTVDLIFRDGINWKAFANTFKKIQVENADTELAIQSIENKGDGIVIVKVAVPVDANKEKIHSDFTQNYQLALEAVEEKYKAQLQAKEEQIVIYRQQSAEMKEIVSLLANKPINVQVEAKAESKSMTNSNDSSRKIEIGSVGGNFNASGQALNLGDISGKVTNTINELPASPEPEKPGIKELLIQLQTAIEAEENLTPKNKEKALKQVKALAEASQNTNNEEKRDLADTAITMLKGIISGLPTATTLVEACSKFLPLISNILGLG